MDNYKITESELVSGVVAAPDTLTDTPQNNKMVFDRLPRLIAGKYNQFISAVVTKFTDYYTKAEADEKETALNAAISQKANTADVYEKSETYSKSEADQMVENKVIAAGAGDMTKAVYDKDKDGIVDTAENALALGGKAASLYALKTEVDDSEASADEAMAAAQAAQTAANNAQATAGAAQTAANNAQNTASNAQVTANNAMPKAGGTFTGEVSAISTNRKGYVVRNCGVVSADGNSLISTNRLRFQRKVSS